MAAEDLRRSTDTTLRRRHDLRTDPASGPDSRSYTRRFARSKFGCRDFHWIAIHDRDPDTIDRIDERLSLVALGLGVLDFIDRLSACQRYLSESYAGFIGDDNGCTRRQIGVATGARAWRSIRLRRPSRLTIN